MSTTFTISPILLPCPPLTLSLFQSPPRFHACITQYPYTVRVSLHPAPQVRTAFARARARIVMSLLGLTRCADTVVGNEKLRGVR